MKKILIVIVAAHSLAAFGCTNKRADCGKAVDNGTEVQKADLPTGIDDKKKGKMKDLAMSHCKDDKWADDVLQCMSEAKTGTDFKSCQSRLTPEQKGSMQNAMSELMAREGMAPAGRDSSAPAGGSGAGSAAAGTAEHP